MIQLNVFPGRTKKIVTFSYDDGPKQDERLVGLFNKYGVKATFHLNGGPLSDLTAERAEELRSRYRGHEISCHTITHGWPSQIPSSSLVNEVFGDRKILERLAGYPVIGMSYPSGDFCDDVVATMKSCGIVYSRTTLSTNRFRLPADFMRWHPTCHHNDAKENIERFLAGIDSEWTGSLLYIWGHSHEFTAESHWQGFEENLAAIAGNEKIWYATNLEIYRYITAQKSLVVSADERMIYNPSAMTVYVEKDKSEIIEIGAGETYRAR